MIEVLRGKSIPERVQNFAAQVGIFVLFGIMMLAHTTISRGSWGNLEHYGFREILSPDSFGNSDSLWSNLVSGFIISDIRLEGLQRVSAGTAFGAISYGIGDSVGPSEMQDIARSVLKLILRRMQMVERKCSSNYIERTPLD